MFPLLLRISKHSKHTEFGTHVIKKRLTGRWQEMISTGWRNPPCHIADLSWQQWGYNAVWNLIVSLTLHLSRRAPFVVWIYAQLADSPRMLAEFAKSSRSRLIPVFGVTWVAIIWLQTRSHHPYRGESALDLSPFIIWQMTRSTSHIDLVSHANCWQLTVGSQSKCVTKITLKRTPCGDVCRWHITGCPSMTHTSHNFRTLPITVERFTITLADVSSPC